jgi:hypothetical protein
MQGRLQGGVTVRIPSVFLLAVTGVWAAVGAAAPHAVSAPA